MLWGGDGLVLEFTGQPSWNTKFQVLQETVYQENQARAIEEDTQSTPLGSPVSSYSLYKLLPLISILFWGKIFNYMKNYLGVKSWLHTAFIQKNISDKITVFMLDCSLQLQGSFGCIKLSSCSLAWHKGPLSSAPRIYLQLLTKTIYNSGKSNLLKIPWSSYIFATSCLSSAWGCALQDSAC